MKKSGIFFFFIFINLHFLFSQNLFEKGYYIDNVNQRIECFIKNVDWKYNPDKFEYKLSADSESKEALITNVNEFGINDVVKYIRANVELDRSSDYTKYLTKIKEPIFKNETLFLKVLVDGNATLYGYYDANLYRYFFKTEDTDIRQLVHKLYLGSNGTDVLENNAFKQELLVHLKCESLNKNDFYTIGYKKNSLIKVFEKYNTCKDPSFVSSSAKKKVNINITPKIGANFSSFTIEGTNINTRDVEFDNNIGVKFGVEIEYVLPFNNNKWSIFVDPTYQYFKSDKIVQNTLISGGEYTASIDYSSIELPVGIRHFFHINSQSVIFLNGAIVFDYESNSPVVYKRNDGSVIDEIDNLSNTNLAFGIGYKYNRYVIELRLFTKRDLIAKQIQLRSNYNSFTVSIGYEIF